MANGNLLYKPVVPSLGNIAGDVKTAMQQALQYKQQKERYEQQRKDMMFKNFLANAQVKPFTSVRKNNQKMLGDVMKKYEDQVQSLVSEIDGDADDREIIMKGRQLAVDTQQEINKIKSWEEQNAADRVAIQNDWEHFPYETKEGAFGYEGGKKPDYSMRKMIPDWRKEIKETKNEMYKGDEATFTVVNESTGKKITSENELVRYFWNQSEDGDWKPDVEHQKQFFRSRLVSNDRLRASLLNEFNVKGKKVGEDGSKYRMPNKEVYEINEDGIVDYAYDVMGSQVFMMKPERKIEPADEDKGDNLTQTERNQLHVIPEKNVREYGEITFTNFVELGHRNLKGTTNFDKKADLIDPTTGKKVNIKGSRGYIIGGVDPMLGGILIGVKGYKRKKTVRGLPLESLGGTPQFGVPKTKEDYTFFVADVDKYKGLLEQEKFVDQEGNAILGGGESTSGMDYDSLFE